MLHLSSLGDVAQAPNFAKDAGSGHQEIVFATPRERRFFVVFCSKDRRSHLTPIFRATSRDSFFSYRAHRVYVCPVDGTYQVNNCSFVHVGACCTKTPTQFFLFAD